MIVQGGEFCRGQRGGGGKGWSGGVIEAVMGFWVGSARRWGLLAGVGLRNPGEKDGEGEKGR